MQNREQRFKEYEFGYADMACCRIKPVWLHFQNFEFIFVAFTEQELSSHFLEYTSHSAVFALSW